MFLIKALAILFIVASSLNAREIKISVSYLGTTGQMVDTREKINGKEGIYIQRVGVVNKNNPKELIQPELPSELYGNKKKHIGEWRDLYDLAHDAMKKNIIQGTAVDYFEHNNEKYQRTMKWEGTDIFNFSLTINIDKQ